MVPVVLADATIWLVMFYVVAVGLGVAVVLGMVVYTVWRVVQDNRERRTHR